MIYLHHYSLATNLLHILPGPGEEHIRCEIAHYSLHAERPFGLGPSHRYDCDT